MDYLLKKIYDAIVYEKDAVLMDRRVQEEIKAEVIRYGETLDEGKREELQELVCSITEKAEYEGFWLGVKYALRILRLLP